MQKFTRQELVRIRQAVNLQAINLRKMGSPATRSVEQDLSNIDNKLREVANDLDSRGRATLEVA